MANENATKIAGALRRVFQQSGAFTDGAAGTLAGTADPGDLCVRIDSPSIGLYQNTNTKASPTWGQISAGGVTLDGAYDYGGAGSGKAVTVDSGAIAFTNNAANNNGVLTLGKSPTGAQSGVVLAITVGAQSTGAAVTFDNSGSGNDITGSGSLWSITKAGLGSFTNLALLEGTAPAGTVVYIARDNDGDAYINALTGKSVIARVAGTAVATFAGAAITLAQAVTISAGGLIVSTGGAAITGNSTVTGDLTVTGSLTFGGNWTVAATLTVDELVLDTDGTAPAGTNCYAVRDNGGDLTLNCITGKSINLAINNTDQYTFSATVADFNDAAIDNAGYIILNAATAPAVTEVYLVNDNTGDLTLNALAGKTVNIAIAGVDEVALGDSGYIFNEASGDRNFRVETNGMAYAIYSDGGKDSLVLGSNTDVSAADHLIRVGRAARANTAATNYFDLVIESVGAITTTGVTAIVATVYLAEPNITIGANSVTLAATLYVAAAPTEATANYGIVSVGAIGLLADAADLAIGASADCLFRWSTGDADNHALALGLGASLAMHICQAADIATDWNVAADVNPALYIHGATTPATEYVKIYTDETAAHLTVVGATLDIVAVGAVTFNDGSADIDLRAESNGMEYAFYVDGAKDALVLGSNTDTSSADQLITVSRAARTATAATNYYDFIIAPVGAVTVPAGTTAIVATARFNEPNITATGTVTLGCTVYMASQPTEGTQNAGLVFAQDVSIGLGNAAQARILWESADANANELLIQLPTGGATDVPVIVIGQAIENLDLNLYNGTTEPRIAVFGVGAVTTAPVFEFRKARGSVASPTAITTGDDLGTLTAYACVAGGEYVQSASILFDSAGTIATTRGAGQIKFYTATDAAPSVLTLAMTINQAQLVTCAAGVTLTTGNMDLGTGYLLYGATGGLRAYGAALATCDITGNIQAIGFLCGALGTAGDLTFSVASDIVMPAATAAALEVSDGTTKFAAFDTRVTTVGVTTIALDISDYTLASAAGAVATGLSMAAHTLNLTGNTQVTSEAITANIGARSIVGAEAITVDKASTLKLVAPIEGANVTLTAAAAIRIGDTTGTPTNQYGIFIEALTAGATADYAIWVAGANAIHLGTEGAATGLLEISGATSGTVGITAAAATTSYTLTLPPAANSNAGYQLTCAGADTLTSWAAAASMREFKDILSELPSPKEALDRMIGTNVYKFHYKEGKGTCDTETEYVGLMADEAPWAMHYKGGVVNPINTLGYAVLGFKAMAERILQLEQKLAANGIA